MADRILVLREGRRQQLADPHTLYHAPANEFVARFIGSAPMNFLPVQPAAAPLKYSCRPCGPHLLKSPGTSPLCVLAPDTPIWLNLSQGPHHFFDPHTGMALVQR